jgi:raffinose/stachyose/melibiose transport system permease protein
VKGSTKASIASHVVLLAMMLVTLFPLVAALFAAMKEPGSPVMGLQWPDRWSLDTFMYAWDKAGFSDLMMSSLIVILFVVPIAMICALMAGYALGTLKLRFGKPIYLFLILGLTLPIELMIIPLYHDFSQVGLLNSYQGVILAEIGLFMPFGTFWMTAHFASLPSSLIEAAQLDGASRRVILWRVLLPGARPSMTTLGVLYFIWSWNQFLLPLVLITSPGKRTAPAGLGSFAGEYTLDVPGLSAATLLTMLPPLVVYLFFQRHFISGMLHGAIKG